MVVRRFLTLRMQKFVLKTYTKDGSGNAAAFLSKPFVRLHWVLILKHRYKARTFASVWPIWARLNFLIDGVGRERAREEGDDGDRSELNF